MQKISARGRGFILDNMRIDRSGEHVVQSLANGAWGGGSFAESPPTRRSG